MARLLLCLPAVLLLLPAVSMEGGDVGSKAEAEKMLRAADDAYLDGRYDEAASYYFTVADGGLGCADIWFNAGNAFWKSAREGKAVLAWERALLIDPRHPDARANLRLAREQLVGGGMVPVSSVLERMGSRLPPGVLAWGFGVFWLLMVSALVLRRIARLRRAAFGLTAAACLIVSVVLGGLLGVAAWYQESVDRAVVMETAKVREGPAPRFRSHRELLEGYVVRIVGYEGPYARIRLDGDNEGWVLLTALTRI